MSKNPLKNFDYEQYEGLKNWAKDNKIFVVHAFNEDYPFGGMTFAWQRTSEFKNHKMVKLAVSFCNPKDQFVRRVGHLNVLTNMYNGSFILVPFNAEDSGDIVESLRNFLTPAFITFI